MALPDNTITISFLGYLTQEIKASDISRFSKIVLVENPDQYIIGKSH